MRNKQRSVYAYAASAAVIAVLVGALPAAAQLREVKKEQAPVSESVRRENFVGPKVPPGIPSAVKAEKGAVPREEVQKVQLREVKGEARAVRNENAGIAPSAKPPLEKVPGATDARLAPKALNEVKRAEVEADSAPTKARRTETKAQREERETKRAGVEAKQQEHRRELEAKRAEAEAKRLGERTELQEKLKTVRDEKKRAAVTRLDASMNEMNKKTVTLLEAALVKIEKVLGGVSERVARLEGRGAEVEGARNTVTAAENAIGVARTALAAQAARTYGVTVSSEVTLQSDLGGVRQVLMRDLIRIREVVKEAHDSVRRAAVAFAKVEKAPAESSGAESVNQ